MVCWWSLSAVGIWEQQIFLNWWLCIVVNTDKYSIERTFWPHTRLKLVYYLCVNMSHSTRCWMLMLNPNAVESRLTTVKIAIKKKKDLCFVKKAIEWVPFSQSTFLADHINIMTLMILVWLLASITAQDKLLKRKKICALSSYFWLYYSWRITDEAHDILLLSNTFYLIIKTEMREL